MAVQYPEGDRAQDPQEHGVEAVAHFLDERHVGYEVVEHRPTFTAAAEARASGVTPERTAKTVVLRDHGGYRIAIIPASRRLDLHKVRELLEDAEDLRLATEGEMASDFAAFEVGSVPPFGPMLPAPEILDRRLLELDRVACTAGDHRHSLLVDPHDIVRIAEPRVADICHD